MNPTKLQNSRTHFISTRLWSLFFPVFKFLDFCWQESLGCKAVVVSWKCFLFVCFVLFFFFLIEILPFFSVIVDSVTQLLASGTVGDGETNGYYSLVIVVIALLGKKKNTAQWACNETTRKTSDNINWCWSAPAQGWFLFKDR